MQNWPLELPKLINTGFSNLEGKGCNYKLIFSLRGSVRWLKEPIFCLDTFSSEEGKANMVSHLQGYILAIRKVPSSSQPDTMKDRLTPALPGTPHNDTEEKQDFSHMMLHRLTARTQQNLVHFFPREFETIKAMPVKLSKAHTQHSSELTFTFFISQLKLPETSYTCEKGWHHQPQDTEVPTCSGGSLPLWVHHRHLPAPVSSHGEAFSGSGIRYSISPTSINQGNECCGVVRIAARDLASTAVPSKSTTF